MPDSVLPVDDSRSIQQLHLVSTAPDPPPVERRRSPGEFVRRRGSIQQGRALETLGHSVEYLVDSRMFQLENHDLAAEQEAIQILMRLSRAVFAECPEVVTLRRRLKHWISQQLLGAREPASADQR